MRKTFVTTLATSLCAAAALAAPFDLGIDLMQTIEDTHKNMVSNPNFDRLIRP